MSNQPCEMELYRNDETKFLYRELNILNGPTQIYASQSILIWNDIGELLQ